MNFLSVLALAFSVSVLVLGFFLSTDDISIFFDPVSLFIVFGGTTAATAISFRLDRILILFRVFILRIFQDKSLEMKNVVTDLMMLADINRKNPAGLKTRIDSLHDFFLKECMEMMVEDVFTEEELFDILEQRAQNMFQLYAVDASKFRTIGKFPPAFGLMGTTMGMIVLLSNLSGADAAKTIGPAMSICLITTLYGVALANLFVVPVAENLTTSAKEVLYKNNIIVEGIKLIYHKKNPVVLAEVLNSFLRPGDRVDWRKAIGNYVKEK